MTTRTKLYITSYTTCAIMMLSVFSQPLHIPEAFQWGLTIGVFIPLGMTFYYIKKQKREKLEPSGVAESGAQPSDDGRQRIKRRLILMMGLGVLVGLCAPLWLPVTGTTLGTRGDFVCGIITAAVVCLIVGLRLRKI